VNAKRAAVMAVTVVVAVGLLLLGMQMLFAGVDTGDHNTYTEQPSTIHAPAYANATNGHVALKVNAISDSSDPATANQWIKANGQAGVYAFALAPPPGYKYLIANITVSNVQQTSSPFKYTSLLVVAQDGRTYYANYAVCTGICAGDVLKNRTLSANFTGDLYVLFSVPATAEVVKLVYASSPPIEMALL